MSKTFDIYLNSGMDQGSDRVFLDQSALAYAQNVRLDRAGRLQVRPGFTALSVQTMSAGTLNAFDVTNHAGRLVALGDQTGAGRATDVFEWVASASKWRGAAGRVQENRLPTLTDVRQIGMLPDQYQGVRQVSCAASPTFLCIVVGRALASSPTLGELGTTVLILDPSTNQTLFCEDIADLKGARVVYAGTNFWVFGVNGVRDIVSYNINPASDEALTGPTTRLALAGDMLDLAIGPFGTGFGIAYSENGSNTSAITYNSSGVQQATWIVDATDSGSLACVGNGAGTLFSVVRRADGVGTQFTIETFNAAGATTSGPTTIFSGATSSADNLGCCLIGSDVLCVGYTNPDVHIQRVTQATHALGTDNTYFDAQLHTAPITVASRAFISLTDQNSTIRTWHVIDEADRLPQMFIPGVATCVNGNSVGTPALIGSKIYLPVLAVAEDTGNIGNSRRFSVYEVETVGTGRRQMASVGGELLISGALPMTYDGRALSEQGLAERPRVVSGAQSGGGSLTVAGVYNAIATWEVFDGRGRLLHSQASSPLAVTLAGANNSIAWTVTTPHSLRRHPLYADQGLSVRVRLYRSEAGQGVFFLDNETIIASTDLPAARVTVNSSQSDTNLIDNIVLYEQSQTPLSHVGPQPYRYVYPTRERAFAGGLPEEEAWAQSKLLFPGEPVEWAAAARFGFSGRVGQPITAVAAFETVGVLWTKQEIWQIPGRGPEHNGDGEFDSAAQIATPGGCQDWRSVIVTPRGAFFQMRDDRLMLLGRDGSVSWAGSFIQDTLASFPVIVGAVFVRELDQVAFACNNAGGTNGVMLIYDMQNDAWFVDLIGEAMRSVSELDGRLVYVASDGRVLWQNLSPEQTTDALPVMRIDTADFRFAGVSGWLEICKILLVGTFLGPSTAEAFISYDGGATYTSLGSYTLAQTDAGTYPNTAAGVDLGTVLKEWIPNIRTANRFRLRFDVQSTDGTGLDTGALRLHAISIEVEAEEGQARLPSRDKR